MKELQDPGILLHWLLLHQDLLLAVLRDGGVAVVELQLVVTVLRLDWLVVGVFVGVVSRRTLVHY